MGVFLIAYIILIKQNV